MNKLSRPLIFILVALGYFAIGSASLKLATINQFASPIWLASGFAVGSLVLGGLWLAPAIFLGALLTNFIISTSLVSLTAIATGNMLEAVVGAYLLTYILKKQIFKSYTEFTAVFLVAALSPIASATIGVSALALRGLVPLHDYVYTWFTWWSGDAVGIIIALPIFVEFFISKYHTGDFSFKKILGAVLLGTLAFGLTYLVFVKGYNQAFSWIFCPFFILAGLTLGKKLSRLLLLIISGHIIYLAAKGYGPFEFGHLNINLIYLQCLIISYSFSTLFARPLASGLKAGRIFVLSNFFGWAIVFAVIFTFTKTEKIHLTEDLQDSIHASVEDIKKEAIQHELLFEASEALLQIKPLLYFHEWKEYVTSLRLSENYPAMVGLGFIREVEKKNMSQFMREVETLGVKDFHIKEVNKAYSDQFPNRYIMTYIEPLDKNFSARGMDIGSDKQRRLAADEARLKRKTVSTDSIKLIQDATGRTAFSLLHPVWSLDHKFKGWIGAPIISKDFFARAFAPHAELLNLTITHNNNELFSKRPRTKRYLNPIYTRSIDISIFGLNHNLKYDPTTAFFRRHSHSAAPLALLLSLFMLFISGFLLEQMTFSQRAEILIKKRTEQLEESKIKLIHSSKMASLGEMASAMAHEINNPITIILGKIKVLSFMLSDLNVNSPEINEEIRKIEQTTGRISKIVKGLKSFSRVADDDPFELVPLEVVLHETLDLCAERLKVSGIRLQIDEVPLVCILCRPGQISQVFLNMLNNSSDALINATEKVISLKFEIKEPDRLLIMISDTGLGIAPDIIPRIMEPFFTTKGVGKGTGLGLSIAKGIIEDHGGSITLDTNQSHTRFIIELPLKNV